MQSRIRAVFVFFLLIFIVIILRLFYWQVISYDQLKSLAEHQTMTSLTIPASRGQIFATDGSPLVLNQRAFLVYLEPYHVKEKAKVIEALSKSLQVDQASISAMYVDDHAKWLPVAQKVEESKIESLRKTPFEGLGFLEDPKRYYPESSMAAHLLGFVGKNGKGEDQGYFGIEGFYDEQLRGKSGERLQEADALGNPIIAGKIQDIPAENGRDLTLTIDKTIQFSADKHLKEGIEKYGAKGGTAIIMDPYTGAILAMSSYPSYFPGDFATYPSQYYKNPAVSEAYEPGSTFKTLVMAAGINEGKIGPMTKFNEDGPVSIGGYTINTWDHKYRGEETMTEVLQHSSNVGMVFVERQLGHDLLVSYINKLGIGNVTDIDLQDESSPDLRPRDKWYEIDYATASFGQGIAATPLQMVRGIAAVANGGTLMRPYLVKSIDTKKGKVITIQPHVESKIFKKETTDVVAEMMAWAVDKGETSRLKPKGYRIAGKTGTAQIPIEGHYDSTKTLASFIGFAPAEKPKFAMLVTINQPTASEWGAETAAPVFFAITKDIFAYYGVSATQ